MPPSGGELMGARFDLSKVLARLAGADPAARDGAGAELLEQARFGLNTVEALQALHQAAEFWPPRSDGHDTATDLVWAASRTPRRVYVSVLEERFGRYGEKAKVEALRLLFRIGDRRAFGVWMTLAGRHVAELTGLGTDALLDDPRHLDLLFPDLLGLTRWPALAAEICDATCALLADGELTGEGLAARAADVLAAETASGEAMARLRAAAGEGWERQAEYLQARSTRTALLDLVGWLPGAAPEAALRRALAEADRRVKAFAVAGLVRRGAEVAPEHLAEIAADLDLRAWLQSRLAAARKPSVDRAGDPG